MWARPGRLSANLVLASVPGGAESACSQGGSAHKAPTWNTSGRRKGRGGSELAFHVEVLDAAYRLIRHNDPDRLEVQRSVDKRLVSAAGGGDATAVRHLHFESVALEAGFVADEIARRIGTGGGERPGDFAVLVLDKVIDGDPASLDENERVTLRGQLANLRGNEESRALVESLKSKASISIQIEGS